MQFSIRDQ